MTFYLGVPVDPASELRMYCFHHAGGGPSLFRGWQRALAPEVQVLPVLLPGRDRRIREPRFTDIDRLVKELDRELGPSLEQPYVLFGHSMGALIAHRLAAYRSTAGGRLPEAVILSGCRPPHLPSGLPPADRVSEAKLVSWLNEVGGLPDELLQRPEWLALLLPILVDDLTLCASAAQQPFTRLPCPVHVFGGDEDPLAGSHELSAWRTHADAEFTVTTCSGGHFYLKDSPAQLLAHLRKALCRYRSPLRTSS
ncbi:thioesterase II family protein [Streptomyces roseifaciens]|uniref:thioesterase II family protein n=1 Tax=Streptomyces roseifaciens TaxID=1488406 RepID=UPI000A81D1DB|nr:alpha/beta fold hydrolase [Streptomyces roseifaciens]